MGTKVYKNNNDNKQERKISLIFLDVYLSKDKKLFKNYILAPDFKIIK